jgi:hypothetical protein
MTTLALWAAPAMHVNLGMAADAGCADMGARQGTASGAMIKADGHAAPEPHTVPEADVSHGRSQGIEPWAGRCGLGQ